MAVNTISGGGFQDSGGNPLAGGELKLQLNHDAYADSTLATFISAGEIVSYILDDSGNVPNGSQAWPNDLILDIWNLLPDTFYIATAYSEDGQLAWGPNSVYILSTPSPYDLSTQWILTNPE